MELYQESDSCQEESDGVWNAAQCCRDGAEGGEGNQAGGLQSKRQEDLQGKRRQSGTQDPGDSEPKQEHGPEANPSLSVV